MMLGEESSSADYWKKCGDEALANGIKGVVMMVMLSESTNHGLVLTILVGRALGRSWGCYRSISKPSSRKEPCRICASIKICPLPVKTRLTYLGPVLEIAQRSRIQHK